MDIAVTTKRKKEGPPDHRGQFWNRLLSPASANGGAALRSNSLAGKRVMITGAGGSIGSALAHAAAASMPSGLVLLDNSENGLYQVDRSLQDAGSHQHVSVLGSVCNANTLDHVFAEHRPEIIFHAAALKHVPLMEQNPFAAIENNVFGTKTLMDAADAYDVEQLILVSTDKAVEPSSMMGASKRVAELLLLSTKSAARMTVVRLCNVMGSQGSVLPLFLEQIAKGGHVTVTHPEVQRYFVTLEEAVGALFGALDVCSQRALLLPAVGEARRILDLAQHLIETQRSSAAIEITGLRAGDKLAEQLVSGRESFLPDAVVELLGLRVIETPLPDATELGAALQTLREAIHCHDLQVLLRGVWALVPEYHPSSVLTAGLRDGAVLEPAAEMQA